MTDQDLVYLSGEEVLKLFRSKELSPVEFMKAILEQAHKAHEAVNCATFMPLSETGLVVLSTIFSRTEAMSLRSWPEVTFCIKARSFTVRAIGPV